MSEATFKLKVVTPNEVFYEGDIVHVQAPGAEGYFGVLKNHAPLISTVGAGNLTFREESGKTKTFKIEGGFVEVFKNRVLVLTDKISN